MYFFSIKLSESVLWAIRVLSDWSKLPKFSFWFKVWCSSSSMTDPIFDAQWLIQIQCQLLNLIFWNWWCYVIHGHVMFVWKSGIRANIASNVNIFDNTFIFIWGLSLLSYIWGKGLCMQCHYFICCVPFCHAQVKMATFHFNHL